MVLCPGSPNLDNRDSFELEPGSPQQQNQTLTNKKTKYHNNECQIVRAPSICISLSPMDLPETHPEGHTVPDIQPPLTPEHSVMTLASIPSMPIAKSRSKLLGPPSGSKKRSSNENVFLSVDYR